MVKYVVMEGGEVVMVGKWGGSDGGWVGKYVVMVGGCGST